MAGAVKSITCANGWVTAASGGTIDTADVTNGAITFAKIQSVSTGVLLGRSASGTGAIETISVGSGLTLSSGTLSSSGGYTDEQAQDAIGTILLNSDSIQFAYTDGVPSITAVALLSAFGSLESTVNGIRLDGDTSSPGSDYFYGTNSSGDKGWYPRYVTAPTTPADSGVAGQMAYDGTYAYLCHSSNAWWRFQPDAWA
jgi:hypothetical protein